MSQIKAHTCLQLSSKSSGRWSKMKWVIGETGSSAPVTGSAKMEAEEVLSCLGGWNSHGIVSHPCLFPQPPFLIILPLQCPKGMSPEAFQTIFIFLLLSPNLIVLVLSLCLVVQVRDESSPASLQPLHWNGELQHALIPTTELPFAGMCHGPGTILDDWCETSQPTLTTTSWGTYQLIL